MRQFVKKAVLTTAACLTAVTIATAQAPPPTKGGETKGQPSATRALNSPVRTQVPHAFGEGVLRSTPFPGTAAFGATEDLSTSILFFGDLYNATIYRFNKDLTPDLGTPTIPGVVGTQVGLAWDPIANSLWIMDLGAGLIREVVKTTGAPTGRTLTLDPANAVVPAPMTIDPADPDVLVYEDIATDTYARIRISTNAILPSIPNPCGTGVFGNGVSWAPGNNLDVTCAPGASGPGAMRIWTGNPLRMVCGAPYAFLPTADIATVTGDTFVNEIQYSIDATSGGAEVWYVAGNANNVLYEVGPIGPRPSNIKRFGAGNVGSGAGANCSIFVREGFDGIPTGIGSIPLGWATSSTTANGDWGAQALGTANTAPQAEFTTDISVVKDDRLDSPLIALPAVVPGQPIQLRFWHTFALENTFDGVVLEASTDGGATFADIGGLVTQNPPNVVISSSFASPIGGRTAWSGGAIGAMVEVIANLDTLASTNVILRWRHVDDNSVSVVGYYLDSVCIGRGTGCARANTLFVNRSLPVIMENFDGIPAGVGSIPAGWSTSSPTLNGDWGARVGTARSNPNSEFSSDIPVVKDDYLDTPTISLVGAGQVQFWHNYATETTFDGGVLEISTDGGATFTDDLGAFATENGYNGILSSSFASPLSGRAAWHGSSGGYIRTTIAVPAPFQVATARLRFRFACDNSVSATGWNVDDLSIGGSDGTGGPCRIVNIPLNSRIQVDFDASPCGPISTTQWVLWAWRGPSLDPQQQIAMGTDLGCAVNKTPINGPPAPASRFRCVRGLGFPPSVCTGWIELAPHPTIPFSLARNQGFGVPVIFTLQAIQRDNGASNSGNLPFSVTNAVQINIP